MCSMTIVSVSWRVWPVVHEVCRLVDVIQFPFVANLDVVWWVYYFLWCAIVPGCSDLLFMVFGPLSCGFTDPSCFLVTLV